MEIDLILILELIGTAAFAISGATVAIQSKMDLLGVSILGMTTAVGGGIIRDVILGITPPTAFQKPIYALVALIISILTFLPAIRNIMDMDGWLYLIIDSLGLAVFTIVGAFAGVPSGNAFLIIFVGNITGVGGGIVRDVFANRNPAVFKKNVYATASLAGAILFALLYKTNQYAASVIGGVVIFVLRVFADKFKWDLPRARDE
ncbi:MAG: trimeric intracellular cation channel family protein [Christensenellales bacterium]|jgi:uncharacterized membrane protein YeiH